MYHSIIKVLLAHKKISKILKKLDPKKGTEGFDSEEEGSSEDDEDEVWNIDDVEDKWDGNMDQNIFH